MYIFYVSKRRGLHWTRVDSPHFFARRVCETIEPYTLSPSAVQGKLLDFVMANKEPTPTGRVAGQEWGNVLRRSVLARPAASLLPTTRVLLAATDYRASHDTAPPCMSTVRAGVLCYPWRNEQRSDQRIPRANL